MRASLLLNEIKQISKKYDEIYRNTGGYFNIFSIAHLDTDEVAICRIIRELIDPKGVHHQGAAYLNLFLEYVLGIESFGIEELENAVVEREKMIAEKRRIDLFIKIPDKMDIPIEVKIYAGDQPSQCYDYYKYASDKLYYLTLDGHAPSKESLQNLDKQCVKTISFGKEIIGWLEECLKLPETIRISPIREIMLQLIDVLRKLTNQSEDKMEKEILNLILESKENFKSAEMIAKTLKAAEEKIFDQFYKALHKRIIEKYLDRLTCDEVTDDEAYGQYGIFYTIKKLEDGNRLCLDITCEHTLYAGIVIYDKNDEMVKCKGYLSQDEIMTGNWQSAEYWIAWKYLGYELEERPNFKHHNEAFYALLRKDGLSAFVEESMKTIDELMNSLK